MFVLPRRFYVVLEKRPRRDTSSFDLNDAAGVSDEPRVRMIPHPPEIGKRRNITHFCERHLVIFRAADEMRIKCPHVSGRKLHQNLENKQVGG